jgi:curved DNA-binding protein CbpA
MAMEQRRQQTLYEVLQISPKATSDVILAAYRVLARTYHPDLNAEPVADRQMGELNAAYAVLSDRARRAHYDAQLARAARATGGGRRTAARSRRADGGRLSAAGARRAKGSVCSPIAVTASPTTPRSALPVERVLAAITLVLVLAAMLTFAVWFVADALDDSPNKSTVHLTETPTSTFGARPAEAAPFTPARRSLNP